MIKGKTAENLRHIVNGGGSVHVDGASYTADNLRHIANGLRVGAQMIVSNSDRLTIENMRHVANGATEGATVLFQ